MVEESWGETFRELRESKNLSLSKVSGDYKNSPNYITSKVQLSRFERNESDITLTKISKLVEKLGITFEEYLSYVRDFEQSEASNFIDELQRLTELGNYEEIENLYEKSIQNFSKMNQKIYYWNSLEAKAILASNHIKNYQITENEAQEVADYLFSILEWGQQEIYLFGELLNFLSEALIFEFIIELLNRKSYYNKSSQNKELIILLTKTVTLYFIEKKNKDFSESLINQYRQLLDSPTMDIHNRKEFMYVEGCYYLMIDETEKGKNILNNLSNGYKAFGYPNIAKQVRKVLKEKLENRNK